MTGPRPPLPERVIDPGVQAERTYLAWQRTALAFAGVGALLLYSSLSRGPATAVVGGFGVLVGTGLFLRAHLYYRRSVAAARAGRPTADRRLLAAVATAASLLALAELTALLLPLSR